MNGISMQREYYNGFLTRETLRDEKGNILCDSNPNSHQLPNYIVEERKMTREEVDSFFQRNPRIAKHYAALYPSAKTA